MTDMNPNPQRDPMISSGDDTYVMGPEVMGSADRMPTAALAGGKQRSQWADVWRELRHNWVFWVGAVIVFVMVLVAPVPGVLRVRSRPARLRPGVQQRAAHLGPPVRLRHVRLRLLHERRSTVRGRRSRSGVLVAAAHRDHRWGVRCAGGFLRRLGRLLAGAHHRRVPGDPVRARRDRHPHHAAGPQRLHRVGGHRRAELADPHQAHAVVRALGAQLRLRDGGQGQRCRNRAHHRPPRAAELDRAGDRVLDDHHRSVDLARGDADLPRRRAAAARDLVGPADLERAGLHPHLPRTCWCFPAYSSR